MGGSIAVGSEMSGGVADVLITDCLMRNLSGPVLSYRWTQHRGGFIRNITGEYNTAGSHDMQWQLATAAAPLAS